MDIEESAVNDIIKAIELDDSVLKWVKKDNDFKKLYNNKKFLKIIKEKDKE